MTTAVATKPGKPANVDFNAVAAALAFTGKLDYAKHGLKYRKGKTVEDVRDAMRKAKKHGQAKTETELSMLSIYLADVFLRQRTT